MGKACFLDCGLMHYHSNTISQSTISKITSFALEGFNLVIRKFLVLSHSLSMLRKTFTRQWVASPEKENGKARHFAIRLRSHGNSNALCLWRMKERECYNFLAVYKRADFPSTWHMRRFDDDHTICS